MPDKRSEKERLTAGLCEERFLAYASRYDRSDSMIGLKVVHTLRVAEVMDVLTGALGLDGRMRELARICALCHDIGRFEQVKRYGTFNDSVSCDHAALGCRILEEEHILDGLPEEDKEKVVTAVRRHNRIAVGTCPDEETLLLSKLIRDADKCDIFRVFAQEDMRDTMGETVAQVEAETVTDEVFALFMERRCVPRAVRKTGLDIWVGFLGFFYDMNFDAAVRLARREGFYRMPFDRARFGKEETRRRTAAILESLEKSIDERLSGEE